MQQIWNSYREAAARTGRDPVTGEAYPFSLEFFYGGARPQDQNPLVRAFLGDPTAQLEAGELPDAALVRQHASHQPPLYDAQVEAIRQALASPLSLVQGPPGTGKTEMILSLLAVLLELCPGCTAAVVSTNNEALRNIVDKLEAERGQNPALARVYSRLAVLGRKSNVRQWRAKKLAAGENVSAIDRGAGTIDHSYLQQYPLFTSTVHSLRKIFTGQEFDGQFDFVIADECSQMSLMVGVIAMSCAKHLVLIGDSEQLAPVITSELEECFENHPELPDLYKERAEKSFLQACAEKFPTAPNTFLNQHYRCHPSIIRFCNQYVYGGQLVMARPDDGRFCMRAVWYEGDWCEKQTVRLPPRRGEEQGRLLRKIYNRRQIDIFLREELPALLPQLQNERFSAAVISPFRYQIEELGARLRQALAGVGLDGEVRDNLAEAGDGPDAEELPCLTIHKAQGKGFDAVYLLPVEDYYRENPWCQRRRIVNVAVSRAKREFCIITSSQWLPEELQQQLTGYILPNGEEEEPDAGGMYCRKLLAYIAQNCPAPQGRFGLHRAAGRSVFDLVPRLRRVFSTTGAESLSAPARCLEFALFGQFGGRYTILAELPLREITEAHTGARAAACRDEQLLRFRENARFDFALCEGNAIRLLIEVDGEQHRGDDPDQRRQDQYKDTWVRELLGAGACFVRLTTDGSATDELQPIAARLAEAPAAPALTLPAEVWQPLAAKTRAQYTIDLLLWQLAETVDNAHLELREHFARTDLTPAQKFEAVAVDYTAPHTVRYSSALCNAWYICRYAVAYAFEYAMLCELAMRLRLAGGGRSFSAFSFGAGSFLDAWAMAYAKARLTREDPAFEELRLYYKGVDEQRWAGFFVPPGRVLAARGAQRPPFPTPLGQKTAALFEKVWLWQGSLDWFVRKDILDRPGRPVYYNVLVFPKIINELEGSELDELERLLGRVNFCHDEYYLLVSHSRAEMEASAHILKRLLAAIDPAGEFAVECDHTRLLRAADAGRRRPAGEGQARFDAAWLGQDRLVALAQEEPELAPLRCYAFASVQPGGGADGPNGYIDRHNPDFAYSGPREFLRRAGQLAAGLPGGEGSLRASQVTRVTNIVFDLVMLKRRER